MLFAHLGRSGLVDGVSARGFERRNPCPWPVVVGTMAVMPSAETTALLAEAEPLPYPQRMALLAARARAWTGTPVLDIVLADLSTDRQHRDTALFLAIVAGRIPVRAALADPDPSIQCRALNAWIRSGVPRADDLAQFLIDAPARARQVAYRSPRRPR